VTLFYSLIFFFFCEIFIFSSFLFCFFHLLFRLIFLPPVCFLYPLFTLHLLNFIHIFPACFFLLPSLTVLLPGVGTNRSVRCEPPYRHTMGRHFITVPLAHIVVATRRTSLLTALLVVVGLGHHFISVLSSTHSFFSNWALRDLKTTPNLAGLLCGWIGMMIKVGASGSLQGLTGLAPKREFT
jgi:hypothetical protein